MGNQCCAGGKLAYSKAVSDAPDGADCTAIYRSVYAPMLGPLPKTTSDGFETSYAMFSNIVAKQAEKPFLGKRSGPNGSYEWITYGQVKEMADAFGAGLIKLDAFPERSFEDETLAKKIRSLGFISKNRQEWVIGMQAAYAYNTVIVPLYDTLGPETVDFIIHQTGMCTVLASGECVGAVIKSHEVATKNGKPLLKYIISMDAIPAEVAAKAKAMNLTLMTMTEVIELGRANPAPHTPPKTSDINTICYTSGTTGTPKGAILTHAMFAASVNSLRVIQSMNDASFSSDDVHISYLPFAHVFERVIMEVVTYDGAAVGFYAGDPLKLLDDMKELKPTFFCSVPRLFNRIYEKINSGLVDKSGVARWLFKTGLDTKMKTLRSTGDMTNQFWDGLVFNKVKALLGGRVRFMVTGSAPISSAVHEFIKCVFGVPVFEGFGMTETCVGGMLTSARDPDVGHVGGAMPSVEFKLKSVPEMGYLVTDVDADGNPTPRGELLLRGPSIFPGYFRAADKTKETIDEEGWLHTGDVCVVRPDGSIKILDRAKNIFKLAQGEYIAPEKVENVYVQAPGVGQVFVHGYSTKNNVVAVVVPSVDFIKVWAEKNKKSTDLKTVCNDNDLKKDIVKNMETAAKANGLNRLEQAKAVYLHPDAFTVENDLITPTFKLKRHIAAKVFKPNIDKLYEEIESSGAA